MTKFQPGMTYTTRFPCDANAIIRVTIASRTDKTVRTSAGKVLRIKVCPYTGEESVWPEGRYSMAPVLRASKVAA
jgi:hypothetical protein